MKKIFNILTLALLSIFFVTSCMQDERGPVYNPDNAVLPVLQTIGEEYVLEDGGAFDTFKFSTASFGIPVSIKYTVYADLADNEFANAKTLESATSPQDSIVVKATKLNTALIALGCAAGTPVSVEFRVVAQWMGESSSVGYQLTSNVIKATVTPFNAEREYPKVWVLGGYNGWSHATAEFLYSYSEDEVNYEGIIDFGENAADPSSDHYKQGFKVTGQDNWDDANKNWGMVKDDPAAEDAAALNLIKGNDGQNIDKYKSHRYYKFSINTTSLEFKMKLAFDKVGIIGLAGDWDNDIDMTFNQYKGRFWADVDVASSTEFKIRLNGAWDKNWGGASGALVEGGSNISIDAGQYRIYVYLNNSNELKYAVDATMYGKEEPGKDVDPEPEVQYWSIIGELGDDETQYWSIDANMSESNGVWTGVATIAGQFKLRYGADWGVNRGAEGESEPVTIVLDTPTDVVSGGKNFTVSEKGLYQVAFDTLANSITVSNMGNKWSIIGQVEGSNWDKDFFMTKDGDIWTSDAVTINGIFKLRYNAGWEVNLGGSGDDDPTVLELGVETALAAGGKNLAVDAVDEQYVITLDASTNKVTVKKAAKENCWSLIGNVDGSSWDADSYMTNYAYGTWTSAPVSINTDFKLRFNNSWADENTRGAVESGFTFTPGTTFSVIGPGNNIKAPSTDKFIVTLNPVINKVVVAPYDNNWAVIGEVEGTSWNADFYMAETSTGVWESNYVLVEKEKAFKIRFNNAWEQDYGNSVDEVITVGSELTATSGGKNIQVPETAVYKTKYDKSAGTLVVTSAWALIGVVNGSNWDKDIWMYETSADVWESPVVNITGGFKIRYCGSWADDNTRGAQSDDFVFTSGTAFGVASPGKNISAPANGNYKVVYNSKTNSVTITAQ